MMCACQLKKRFVTSEKNADSMNTKSLTKETEGSRHKLKAQVEVTNDFRPDTTTTGLEFAISTGN